MLVGSLCQCIAGYLLILTRNGLRGEPQIGVRALWLHRSCQLVLRRLGFDLHVEGKPPASGLIASNHLSYFDILFYGAVLPCVFVAKIEVRSWPLLGLLAAFGGTIFIDRKSAASAALAAAKIEALLARGTLVLVFPEGTSSDGAEVLRFHATLFEPAVRTESSVTAAAIGYSAGTGAEERDLCYYGDISFAPHLLETLQLPKITASLHFAPTGQVFEDRKTAAKLTQEAVVGLRSPRENLSSG